MKRLSTPAIVVFRRWLKIGCVPIVATGLWADCLPAAAAEQPVSSPTVASCVVPDCDAVAFVVAAIDAAQSEIRGQSYDFTSKRIAAALIRAKQRGVDVAMLFDKSTPCERNQAVDMLARSRISIDMDVRPRVANNKVLVIDKARVIVGSFDFSTVAASNADNTNLISEPAIAQYFRAYWDERRAKSVAYDADHKAWCAREG